jgi:osmotically inducible protein OsmC
MNQDRFIRTASAHWTGSLSSGKGTIDLQSGALTNEPYSFKTRFEENEEAKGTNPEELLAAAHASCFAMQFSHYLAEAGHPAESVDVDCEVRLEKESQGFKVASSFLRVTATVPGMEKERVLAWAKKAKDNCPLSKVLQDGLQIALEVSVPD